MLRAFPRIFSFPLPQNRPGMERKASPTEVYPWRGKEHGDLYGHSPYTLQRVDLVALLPALPGLLCAVKLSHLVFMEDDGSYWQLLCGMRGRLDWKDRAVTQRPSVSVVLPRENSGMVGSYLCVDEAADKFLYSSSAETDGGGSPNPFGEDRGPANPLEQWHLDSLA